MRLLRLASLPSIFLLAMFTASAANAAGLARLDPDLGDPCIRNGQHLPQVFEPAHCDAVSRIVVDPQSGHRAWLTTQSTPPSNGIPPYESMCWYNITADGALHASDPATGPVLPVDWLELTHIGFRLNLNQLASPGLGDFLPPASTIGADTVALVPAGQAGSSTAWQGISRPTLQNVADLVTGVPLIQVTDLELPLGATHFRLTRTRSGNPSRQTPMCQTNMAAQYRWWDWTGAGWMASENPILIVDSAVPDIVGDNPRTCWLVLDAHRSIPFQRLENTGTYEAPPRFRARLDHNGAGWNAASRTWATLPTEYYVYLYDDALKYTFVIMREDVPRNEWARDFVLGLTAQVPSEPSDYVPSHYHDRPYTSNQFHRADNLHPRAVAHDPFDGRSNPGLGIPYLALCVQIEDRYGHIIEMEYCESRRTLLDDVNSNSTEAPCVECMQNCLAKGQLHTVRLKVRQGASVETRWTLLYSHRMFAGLNFLTEDPEPPLPQGYIRAQYPESDPANAAAWEIHGSIAMDRIYVYRGEVGNIAHVPCLRISHHDECGLNGGVDPLEEHNDQSSSPVEDQWEYLVRYHYATDAATHRVLPVPTLLKTSVLRWDDAADEPREHAVRAYYYTPEAGVMPPVNNANTLPWLEAIFTSDDLAKISAGIAADVLPFTNPVDVDDIALWQDPDSPSGTDLGHIGGSRGDMIKRFASLWVQQPDLPDGWSDSSSPSRNSLLGANGSPRPYLTPDTDATHLESDRHSASVAHLAVHTSEGKRQYRIHRIAVRPDACPMQGSGFGQLGRPGSQQASMRSVYFHPYMWQGYRFGPDNDLSYSEIGMADLSKSRWIAIIDEFADMDRWAEPSNTYDQQGGIQGLLSRRVVEMNPAGFVLRDLTWQFNDGDVQVTGGGLGEQYVYATVEEYLAQQGTPLPAALENPPPNNGSNDHPELPQEDDLARVRSELLLVEHRSVGFSAGEMQANTPGSSSGLLSFFEYTVQDGEDGDGDPATSLPWSQRLKLIAEGIRRGNDALAGPPLYKRQLFYDPPYLATTTDCQVEFLTPRTEKLLSRPPLGPAGPSVAFDYRATFTITEKREPEVTPPDPAVPPMQWPARARQVVGPPRQLRPGSHWYFPVEREFYDEQGSPDWSATGLLHDPVNPASNPENLNSLILTHFRRDAEGRAHYTIADATEGAPIAPPDIAVVGGDGFAIGNYPRDANNQPWTRQPDPGEGQHGLNYVTAFGYDLFGLSDTYFPNGRRWARRIALIPDEESQGQSQTFIAREYIFNDLILNVGEPSGTNWLRSMSPGEIKDYSRPEAVGPPRRTMRVTFPEPLNIYVGGVGYDPPYQELWRIRVAPDANGRIARADLLERDPGGALLAVGSKETNELGEMLREREIDGTITRTTWNSLGQPLRRYVGTCDTSSEQPPEVPNMVLLDRTEYGSGVTDAWLPTITRRYDRHPSWATDYYSDMQEADGDGAATVTRYDWRMRPVRVESYVKGDPADPTTHDTTTTLTFVDHVDRPVLIVTYGAAGPGVGDLGAGLEPTALLDAQTTPEPRLFYDGPWRPTSIVSMRYGPDGTLIERRTYDVAWTPPAGGGGEPPYQAEITYSGQGGAEVFAQRPGQPVTIKRLDGVGRVESVLAVLPGRESSGAPPWSYELTRTDYVYDADGNTIETIRWERVVEDAASELTIANAVRSRTLSWYDIQKRLIATADLGTEQAGHEFVAGTSTFVRPTQAPTSTNPTVVPGMPSFAMIWLYEYDLAGNQVAAVEPSGARTESVYSSTGRLLRKIENASGSAELQRTTAYEYQYGRLIAMTSERTPGVPQDSKQRTLVTYGAEIVDADFDIVSRNNGLIGLLQLPNENGTTNDPPRTVSLRYNFAGQVAERIDARGCALRYHYDDQGRLESVQIGYYEELNPGGNPPLVFRNGYPPSMTPVTGIPADRIACVGYTYDSRGHLSEITCRAQAGGTAPFDSGAIIAQNRFDHDLRGNLLADWQSHGALINPATTPRTEYEWDYIATATASDPNPFEVGRTLLKAILYPNHPSITPRREIELNYATTSAATKASSAISAMTTNIAPLNIAAFQHIGAGRRASIDLAGGEIWQSFLPDSQSAAIGLPGLDAFGRVKDLHFRNDAQEPSTLFRGQYHHDRPGNRSGVIITQAEVGGQSRSNTHSQVNRYDALQRLIATDVGRLQIDVQTQQPILHPVTGLPQIDPANFVRADAWQLDLLGNWIGGAAAGTTGPPGGWGNEAPAAPAWVPDDGGRIAYGQLDAGIPGVTPDPGHEFRTWTHTVNEQNETRLIETAEGDQASPSPTPAQNWVRRDANGNVIYDGTYYYQFDAWNRLIQVNLAVRTDLPAGTELPPVAGEPPRLPGEMTFTVKPGLLVKHYSYDGLGRLVRTQSPWPNPQEGPITKQVKSERFFYDGIRRIQEVVTDPVLSTKGALLSGDPGLIELAEADGEVLGDEEEAQEGEFVFDGDATSLKLEDGQAAAAGGGGEPEYELVTYLAREYIWGPGDSHSGVDELLVYFDANRWAYWVLQDAGGDVVAVCDMNGVDPAGGNAARVCGQWRYDAYGAATAAEHLASFPQIHCGHKALFFDRLDVGVGGASDGPPRLIPYSHLLVHMRNRAYSPQMGRFMQPDPNATALTLIEASSDHGRGIAAMVAAFDVQSLYGDGMNLYEYLGSNPWNRRDPLGLSWDPFSLVDDFQAEAAGSTAAFMSAIGHGLKATAVIAAQIASYLPFPIVGNLGDIALYALGEQSEGDLAAAMALGLIPGGKLAAKFSGLGSFLGKIGSSAWSGAKHYAGKFTSTLSRGASGLMSRARGFLSKACGCFEAQTEVWTARGLVPIEEIQEGDLVIATDESTGQMSLRSVKETFLRLGAPIVAVTMLIGGVQAETFNTTEEHPFYVSNRGWVQAQSLRPGDVVQTLTTGVGHNATGGTAGGVAEVVLVEFTSRRATVYNFEVEGVHTYRIGVNGVLVHNRSACQIDYHHAWPKFLSGPEAQQLVAMPRHLHQRFHGDLYKAMYAAGIRKKRNDTWAAHFAKYPADYDKATNALYEISSKFDAQYLGKSGGYNSSLVLRILHEMQIASGMRSP